MSFILQSYRFVLKAQKEKRRKLKKTPCGVESEPEIGKGQNTTPINVITLYGVGKLARRVKGNYDAGRALKRCLSYPFLWLLRIQFIALPYRVII